MKRAFSELYASQLVSRSPPPRSFCGGGDREAMYAPKSPMKPHCMRHDLGRAALSRSVGCACTGDGTGPRTRLRFLWLCMPLCDALKRGVGSSCCVGIAGFRP